MSSQRQGISDMPRRPPSNILSHRRGHVGYMPTIMPFQGRRCARLSVHDADTRGRAPSEPLGTATDDRHCRLPMLNSQVATDTVWYGAAACHSVIIFARLPLLGTSPGGAATSQQGDCAVTPAPLPLCTAPAGSRLTERQTCARTQVHPPRLHRDCSRRTAARS